MCREASCLHNASVFTPRNHKRLNAAEEVLPFLCGCCATLVWTAKRTSSLKRWHHRHNIHAQWLYRRGSNKRKPHPLLVWHMFFIVLAVLGGCVNADRIVTLSYRCSDLRWCVNSPSGFLKTIMYFCAWETHLICHRDCNSQALTLMKIDSIQIWLISIYLANISIYFFFLFQFVLTEMYYDGFHRSFCDDDHDLNIIQESDSIFAFETPETFRLENIRNKRGNQEVQSIISKYHFNLMKPTIIVFHPFFFQEVFWQTWIIITLSMGQRWAGRRLLCRGLWLL